MPSALLNAVPPLYVWQAGHSSPTKLLLHCSCCALKTAHKKLSFTSSRWYPPAALTASSHRHGARRLMPAVHCASSMALYNHSLICTAPSPQPVMLASRTTATLSHLCRTQRIVGWDVCWWTFVGVSSDLSFGTRHAARLSIRHLFYVPTLSISFSGRTKHAHGAQGWTSRRWTWDCGMGVVVRCAAGIVPGPHHSQSFSSDRRPAGGAGEQA